MKFRIGKKRKNGALAFGDILPDIIQEYNMEKSFTIELLASKWDSIVGDIISTHSMPDRLFKNILYVAADHSVYAGEIAGIKEDIMGLINNMFPHLCLKDIRVELKPLRW